MAWTPAQEKLITEVFITELLRRIEINQQQVVAQIFDPSLTNAQKVQVLKNRLNALKTSHQTELAGLAAKQAEATTFFNGQITLIDSILAQLP